MAQTIAGGTVDAAEVAHFARIADEWWDPKGPMMPLHRLMPTRMAYIRERLAGHFGKAADAPKALSGLRILDIGCGGGLVGEALVRMGADVVGIDPAEENVRAARLHAEEAGLAVDYRATTAEALAASGARFDAVLALEVVEHVADVGLFVKSSAALVRDGGMAIFSTINRTPLAYALMIVGVEYVLRWLPRGTHHYRKFVTPEELTAAFRAAGMEVDHTAGVRYNPVNEVFRLTRDLSVNYFASARKP
jgi:2-polyprenyl-6-hydroxyphenyl methylase/3-demethylubiquinone-9 3-methyltransferase